MSNKPTITFTINGASVDSSNSNSPVSYSLINPLVKFDSAGLAGGLVQPLYWYYYLINNTATATDNITIQVNAAYVNGNDASAGTYPLPAINFMLIGPGGAGGGWGAGDSEEKVYGGNGGGGGTGTVSLVSQYFSGVTSSTHSVTLYPIGSYSSVMTLDKLTFYGYNGANGGTGTKYVKTNNDDESEQSTSYSNGDSGDGGAGGGGGSGAALTKPNKNFLPSYCGTIRGGAGGNGGVKPSGSATPNAGASFNGAVVPVNSNGKSSTGTDPVAYVPVTFADGLTNNNLLYAGVGGVTGGNTTNPYDGAPGSAANVSMFMLYFCL